MDICISSPYTSPCAPAATWFQTKASQGWGWCARVLNKHTDLISSGGILAITTCLLAGKIFDNIPRILPRIAKVVFDFGGIIWLNVQVRDLAKSCRDFSLAFSGREWIAIAEVAAKVLVKSVNVVMTCAIFSGSVVAAAGFPQASLALALAMRPIGLAVLGLNIATDIRDYVVNEAVLKRLTKMEEEAETTASAKVMACFLETIAGTKPVPGLSAEWKEERRLAERIVRQLDTQTVETFQEMLAKDRERLHPRWEALKLFYAVKDGIRSRQAGTKANLSLIALGYVSMGICRTFPDTIVEMGTRWGMSVLYTDELVRQKLFQYDLAKG